MNEEEELDVKSLEIGMEIRGFKLLEKGKDRSRSIVWTGKCTKCGGERKARNRELKDKSNPLLCWACTDKNGFGQQPLPDIFQTRNRMYRNYKRNSAKRKHTFSLTREDVGNLIFKDCYYCGKPPRPSEDKQLRHPHNGIDRLNNLEGYSVENCVPCCKDCNYMKRLFDTDEWFDKMLQILKHQNIVK